MAGDEREETDGEDPARPDRPAGPEEASELEEPGNVEEVDTWPPSKPSQDPGQARGPDASSHGHHPPHGRGPSGAPPTGQAGPQPGYGGYRRPMTEHEARNWAAGAHLSSLVGLVGIPPLVGPLVVWLVKREEHAFVEDQGREALNFQISVLLYTLVGAVVGFAFVIATFGLGVFLLIPLVLVVALAVLGLPILAAVRANEGRRYRYPLTIRFLSAPRRPAGQTHPPNQAPPADRHRR